MSDNMSERVWLIGAGPMAMDYAKVLQTQQIPFSVIGRGADSAANFSAQTGINRIYGGGLEHWLTNKPNLPEAAIVSVGVEQLSQTTSSLLKYGVRRILVEKPAGLNVDEIEFVAKEAEDRKAAVYVAYNRRFYAATQKAEEIIAEDGGVKSFNFEFTEWSHVIEGLTKAPGVKENWFLANSTHVIDLAFFLGGKPREMSCYTAGALSWHPTASIFTGAGISERGALFSYQANWEAPGRWGLEVLTSRHRLIFRPMEQLHVQKARSVAIEKIEIDDELEQRFKPGLYKQVAAFIERDEVKLAPIKDHFQLVKRFFSKMGNF